MGRIILTIPGTWSNQPAVEAAPLTVAFGPAVGGLAEEMLDLAEPSEAFDADEARALRRHRAVLYLSAEFEAPGDLTFARAGARALFSLLARGEGCEAVGAYVETGMKVFSPGSLAGVPEGEGTTLLHLFVEVYGERAGAGGHIATEGMQAFDLPDVEVPYADASAVGAAQAAAFALAARMVCDGVRPHAGHPFRASESAPLFRVSGPHLTPGPAEPDAQLFHNPRGRWRLELVTLP